jgi:hypothetical protein
MMGVRIFKAAVERPILWILALWAIAGAARLVMSGAVYGLDYTLFHPDGTLYHTLALRLLGVPWSDASAQVASFYQQHALRGLPTGWHIDASAPGVGIVYTRPLYSVLSVPFVAVAGQWGMLAVPLLSLLAVGVSLLAIGRRMHAEWVAVLAFAGLTFSTTVMRWSVSNLTDSLQLGLIASASALLVAERDRRWLLLPVGAGLLTRPGGPVWIALLLPFLWRQEEHRRKLMPVLLLAATGTAAVILFSPAAAGVSLTDIGPLLQRLAALSWHAAVIPIAEVGQLAVLDRLLLALLAGAVVLAVRNAEDVWSQAFVSVLVTTMLMGAWVGVVGVNFRYQLPCLIPACIVLIRAGRQSARKMTAAPSHSHAAGHVPPSARQDVA